MAAELQVIPARHGVATYVPAGQTIKIINTSGTQVIDTWAFALPKPDGKKGEVNDDEKEDDSKQQQQQQQQQQKATPKQTPQKKKKPVDLPSQEDAEKATKDMLKQGEQAGNEAKNATPQKTTWSSYVPSLSLTTTGKKAAGEKKDETEQQKDSKTWASYFPSGKGFSSYIPKSASDTVSAFAADHQRDSSKSYLEQLQDFSKTPVGAAGIKGLAAMTGSGYSGSLFAGYQAWNAKHAAGAAQMEFLSMPHSRAATLHLRPKVNDTLVSNLREPILTLVEDKSPGIHDTLIAACDPMRYKGLGVDKWEQHGSCAENLVLALKELNERAGLKGAKGVGADVTINAVPAPLNLFMNIPWDNEGDIGFHAPKGSKGDYVRLKAERDVVVVMSACPQDVLEINNKKPTDAHFLVEGDEDTTAAIKRTQPAKKRPAPRKLNSQSTVATQASGGATAQKKPIPRRVAPQSKSVPRQGGQPSQGTQQKAPVKKPVPQSVQQKKSVQQAPQQTAGAQTNGTATAPIEKKKPRKLSQKPAAAPSEAQGEAE